MHSYLYPEALTKFRDVLLSSVVATQKLSQSNMTHEALPTDQTLCIQSQVYQE